MPTNAFTLKTETPPNTYLLVKLVALLGIFAVSGLFFAVNYWVAVIFYFFGLLLWTYFSVPESQGRNLWLLLLFSLFVAIIAGSLAQLLLNNNLTLVRQWVQTSEVAAALLGDDDSVLLTSILIGLVAAFVIVIIPFLLLVAIATAGVLELHKRDEKISFWDAYGYLLTAVLGISYFAVIVDNGQLKGATKDKQRLEIFGGPGWLTVYPGQVVVLHRAGKSINVVGVGTTMLKRDQRIKAIIPLTARGAANVVENAITQDKIPLKITVSHAAQVEPAAETEKRLQQAIEDARRQVEEAKETSRRAKMNLQQIRDQNQLLEACEAERSADTKLEEAYKTLQEAKKRLQEIAEDETVGDEDNKCYKSIAKLVATKVPIKPDMTADIADSMKGSIAANIRDVIESFTFEELFSVSSGNDGGELSSINNRKIAEIERLVLEKVVKSASVTKGILLRAVDVSEIGFPEAIEEKIVTEATALVEARIKNIEAKTKVTMAQIEAEIRKIKASHLNEINQQQRIQVESIRIPYKKPGSGIYPSYYIAGLPVTDPTKFFDRQSDLAKIINLLIGNFVMLTGPRRIGKTSLLYQLINHLPQLEEIPEQFVPVLVNIEGTFEEEFFHTIMEEILNVTQKYLLREVINTLSFDLSVPAYSPRAFSRDLRTILESLQSITPKPLRLVLLLDEMDTFNSYSQETQSQLRRIFQRFSNSNFSVVITGVELHQHGTGDSSPFYNMFALITLTPFSKEEAYRLITEPVKGIYSYNEEAINRILEATLGSPHRIQQLCLEVIHHFSINSKGQGEITAADINATLSTIHWSSEEIVIQDEAVVSSNENFYLHDDVKQLNREKLISKDYDWGNIRKLFTEGFSEQQLRRLCFDRPEFRTVSDQFTKNMSRADIIDQIFEHGNRTLQVDILLSWAREHNFSMYKKYEPYVRMKED